MSAHRPEELSENGQSHSEIPRVRIALGITHDPLEASKLFSEIQANETGEDKDKRKIVVIISGGHIAKYAACFTGGADGKPNAPPLLIYEPGALRAEGWSPEDTDMMRFRNQLQAFESWMAPTLVSRLKGHLDQSAMIVAVALYSAEQEQALCRILLRRAVDYIYVQDVPHTHS